MTESKIELHDRLRRQGKRREAASWKDAKIKELRSQGLKRAEAGDEAWRLMAEKYPPPPPVPEPDDEDDEEWDDDELDDEETDADEEWDDEGVDEQEQDGDGFEPAPWMIATAREWADDPKTCSDPNSPFHRLMRAHSQRRGSPKGLHPRIGQASAAAGAAQCTSFRGFRG